MNIRKKYTPEEKQQAVHAALQGGESIAKIARRLGIGKSSISRWLNAAREAMGVISKKLSLRQIHDLQIAQYRACIKQEIVLKAKFVCADDLKLKLNEMESFYLQDSKRYTIHLLCELYSVNRSTFINHMRRNKRDNAWWHKHNKDLEVRVAAVFAESNSCYGADKIAHILRSRGIPASKQKVREIMKKLRLHSLRQRKKSEYEIIHRKHKNIVSHDFNVAEPNKLWFMDFAHVELKGKFYSICVIIDAFSRKVVGYRLGVADTTNLLIKTFKAAWENRKPSSGLIFHSDNGSAMSSVAFGRLLHTLGVIQSFSRPYTPCDNAVIESFFNTFRREELRLHQYSSLNTLKNGIDKFIDTYNNKRPHGHNNLLTPTAAEESSAKG